MKKMPKKNLRNILAKQRHLMVIKNFIFN